MEAAAKAQAFAHRLVEFADAAACVSFLETRGVDLDRPNADGWSVLMSACACGASAMSSLLSALTATHSALDSPTTANHREGRHRGLRAGPHGQRALRDGREPHDSAAPGRHLGQCKLGASRVDSDTDRSALNSVCLDATQPLVIQQLLSTPERKEKLRAVADMPNVNGDTRELQRARLSVLLPYGPFSSLTCCWLQRS